MKRLNPKFISIFIIAIYCLAPICAVDLGHDGTNATDDNSQTVDIDVKSNKNETITVSDKYTSDENETVSALPKIQATIYLKTLQNLNLRTLSLISS